MASLLQPVAAAFGWGVALRHLAYRRGWLKTRRLDCPVVSVGNLTVGGTGKTPLVALIAQKLISRGWRPSILTRGYGRRSKSDHVVLGPGSRRIVDAREVGDEAAILAKRLPSVPIVVSADRFKGGRLAEERFQIDVHLLDDGFQHLALARHADLVLLDATKDYSVQRLLPAGRLREPYSALHRAHIIALTRLELGASPLLENLVGRTNPQAKVFRCSTRLSKLRDVSSGEETLPESMFGKPVAAFCGVGNPEAFFADLTNWGFCQVDQRKFRDHHAYDDQDIESLERRARAKGAVALITTEKDAMNLPSKLESQVPIWACAAEVEIDKADAFIEAITSRIGTRRVEG